MVWPDPRFCASLEAPSAAAAGVSHICPASCDSVTRHNAGVGEASSSLRTWVSGIKPWASPAVPWLDGDASAFMPVSFSCKALRGRPPSGRVAGPGLSRHPWIRPERPAGQGEASARADSEPRSAESADLETVPAARDPSSLLARSQGALCASCPSTPC